MFSTKWALTNCFKNIIAHSSDQNLLFLVGETQTSACIRNQWGGVALPVTLREALTGISDLWWLGLSMRYDTHWAHGMPHTGHTVCHTLGTRYATYWAYGMPHTGHTVCNTLGIRYATHWAYGMPHTGHTVCHTLMHLTQRNAMLVWQSNTSCF